MMIDFFVKPLFNLLTIEPVILIFYNMRVFGELYAIPHILLVA
jgi:hypothetical protein